jgi:hypothetical protein
MEIDENYKLNIEIEKKEKELLKELALFEGSTLNSIITLQKQGEQINKINKDINIISKNLSVSEKMIKNMKSMTSFMFINQRKMTEKIENNNDLRYEIDQEFKKNKINYEINTYKNYIKSFLINKNDIKKENNNDIINDHLNKIKNNLENQRILLDEQNIKLENLVENTSNNNERLRKVNRDIKKV